MVVPEEYNLLIKKKTTRLTDKVNVKGQEL